MTPNDGPRCQFCDQPIDAGRRCQPCKDAAPAFNKIRAPYLYGGPVADLIHELKYGGQEHRIKALVRLVLDDEGVQTILADGGVLVPIPLTRRRQRQRGFNQSALFARQLASLTSLSVSHVLCRQGDEPPQRPLSLSERMRLSSKSFGLRSAPVPPKIILLDDVVTSGATLRAASGCLKAAGAQSVHALALARTSDPSGP